MDAGALPLLVDLLLRNRKSGNCRAVNSVIRRAADAITNLAHENSNIKTAVRLCFYTFSIEMDMHTIILVLWMHVYEWIPNLCWVTPITIKKETKYWFVTIDFWF